MQCDPVYKIGTAIQRIGTSSSARKTKSLKIGHGYGYALYISYTDVTNPRGEKLWKITNNRNTSEGIYVFPGNLICLSPDFDGEYLRLKNYSLPTVARSSDTIPSVGNRVNTFLVLFSYHSQTINQLLVQHGIFEPVEDWVHPSIEYGLV